MKQKIIDSALNEISDQYIEAAASPKKKLRPHWTGAVAAVLALALLAGVLLRPTPNNGTDLPTISAWPTDAGPLTPIIIDEGRHGAHAVATAQYPRQHPYPTDESANGAYRLWLEDRKALRNHPNGYADNLKESFSRIVPTVLTAQQGENAVCSPLNLYMALAMLAQITDGNSRGQILELLNMESMDALRTQAQQVWRSHYYNDGLSTSILGSSLWIDENYTCNEETAKLLAEYYFASVFTGDLGTAKMDEALQSWLSSQTGGLLDEYIEDIRMDPLTVLALASTIYYQVQWTGEFHEKFNTEAPFHSPKGDVDATYMNQTLLHGPYYWGEDFGAVALSLEDGSLMWLFLPDEGTTPKALLESGQIFDFLNASSKNQKDLTINLTLPKFDLSAKRELTKELKALGVTDIFQMGVADFSPILQEKDDGYVSEVTHAARVSIDEKGVTAAAFTLILRCGAAMPPEDRMDFVLDRPFLFVIESQDGLPLFAGTVYEP